MTSTQIERRGSQRLELTTMDSAERDPPATSTRAGTPFDDENAEIIFRSSDAVDFHVHKLILSLASPFFADMFAFPQPPAPSCPDIDATADLDTSHDGVPIVHLSEPSSVLDTLLRLLYPVVPPTLTELPAICALLEALNKYDLDAFIHSGYVSAALATAASADPVGVFVLAIRFNLVALDSPALSQISASSYRALSKYHVQCSDAAYTACASRTWFIPIDNVLQHHKPPCVRCWRPDSGLTARSGWVARAFVWRYLDLARFVLARQPFGGAILVKEDGGDAFDVSGKDRICTMCGKTIPESRPALDALSQMLADKVDDAVRAVCLPLGGMRDAIERFETHELDDQSNDTDKPCRSWYKYYSHEYTKFMTIWHDGIGLRMRDKAL
ncbi:hypothetical protein OF83DRAFT_1151825 [Amylostereum chailletii]|nr:hypothetical protein OF83DRAFT_1151825 [Amylostereum chailletii]